MQHDHGKKTQTMVKTQTENYGSQLLANCMRVVRIAARRIEGIYGIPKVSPDECDDYAAELGMRILDENGGSAPENAGTLNYLIRRAQGIILNDRSRYGVDLHDPAAEPDRADPRLTGELSIPVEVAIAAKSLVFELTRTGRRALIASIVPATRQEWADFYGYSNADSWKRSALRGRAEIRSIGEEAIRGAIAAAEVATLTESDIHEQQSNALRETMEGS